MYNRVLWKWRRTQWVYLYIYMIDRKLFNDESFCKIEVWPRNIPSIEEASTPADSNSANQNMIPTRKHAAPSENIWLRLVANLMILPHSLYLESFLNSTSTMRRSCFRKTLTNVRYNLNDSCHIHSTLGTSIQVRSRPDTFILRHSRNRGNSE